MCVFFSFSHIKCSTLFLILCVFIHSLWVVCVFFLPPSSMLWDKVCALWQGNQQEVTLHQSIWTSSLGRIETIGPSPTKPSPTWSAPMLSSYRKLFLFLKLCLVTGVGVKLYISFLFNTQRLGALTEWFQISILMQNKGQHARI